MNSAQKERLLEYLKEFLAHPFINSEGREEPFEEFHKKRISAIPELNSLVTDFLSEKINLNDFKEKHDVKCREFPFWGFKGTSGQMQLNQLVKNVVGDDKELVFRKALLVPKTEKEATEKIDSFTAYILEKRSARSAETNVLSMPRVASVAFVLSYFWELQNKTLWPVSYNSSKRVLDALGLVAGKQETAGQNYIWFVGVMNELASLYKKNVSFPVQNPFWFVEHVLWKQFLKSDSNPAAETNDNQDSTKVASKTQRPKSYNQVVNEWLPPIVADLCDLALNKETEWSKQNNLKPEKAFESKIRIAFTLLGFEATELGQGKGREPDGFAISLNVADGDYAIIYDAKATGDKFRVGTNDRQIYEYIKSKTDELKKLRVNRASFLIVSSQFDESPTNINLILDVYRRTRIPIVMVSASNLLFLIEEKLKDVELDHSRLEQLFLVTGILSKEKIIDVLGIR
ncbi:MAG: hypothetical protein EXS35_10680 [Pedosphaera sp.]|nr:hypothetical protein [Pedosphaera sp.]